jgi:hypothetical protein
MIALVQELLNAFDRLTDFEWLNLESFCTVEML